MDLKKELSINFQQDYENYIDTFIEETKMEILKKIKAADPEKYNLEKSIKNFEDKIDDYILSNCDTVHSMISCFEVASTVRALDFLVRV